LRFLGYQSQQNTVNYYALADCFLLPSLSDPNPLSCLEALWAGLPLMVSEHVGNYPEVVVSGQNGYVFSYEEPLKAVGMLDILITSDQEWKTHASEVSVRIAEETFNPEKAVGNLVKEMVNELERHGNSNEGNSD
ncbi:MAG: glycosyltransferase, partial [Mobilitalea sp.]